MLGSADTAGPDDTVVPPPVFPPVLPPVFPPVLVPSVVAVPPAATGLPATTVPVTSLPTVTVVFTLFATVQSLPLICVAVIAPVPAI